MGKNEKIAEQGLYINLRIKKLGAHIVKGELKAHIHISLYESNTLIE